MLKDDENQLPAALGASRADGPPPRSDGRSEHAATDDEPDRLILRGHAAGIVGCSPATIRRLEKTGLRPILVDEQGVHWHSLKQVQAYAASLKPVAVASGGADGAIAAAAFELFDAGSDAADVVKSLKIPSAAARQLQLEWADLRGVMIISGTTLSKIRGFRTTDDNPILTGEELLQFLEHIELPSCGVCRRTPTFCLSCYERRPRRAQEIVALANRRREQREADLLQRQVEEATYTQAREKAAYDPRAAATRRAAEEALRAARRAQIRGAGVRQHPMNGTATARPHTSGSPPGTRRRTASARTSSTTALDPRGESAAGSEPPNLGDGDAVRRDTPPVVEVDAPIELDPAAPDFLDKLALADERDRERLRALLASSPLTQEEREAFAREADRSKRPIRP